MKRIMVVDDMAIIREPIAKSIESHGYEVVSIAGGEEALAAIQQQRPDLILLDMMMPRLDGLAVLRALKRDPASATIPVIMLTVAAERGRILEAAKLGVRDYMLKSRFTLHGLLERIEAQLTRDDQANSAAGAAHDLSDSPQGLQAVAPARGWTSEPQASHCSATAIADEERSIQVLKDAVPLYDRAEMVRRLAQCGELKALSPTVSSLLEMVNSSACPIETIAKTIQQDQVLAVKILKLANSVVFSRGEPVDSVQKAVQRIGTKQISQVLMNLGIMEQFGSVGGSSVLAATQFWEHSIACGLIAAEIMRSRQGKQAGIDAAFTMGLLHDIGKMMYLEILGAEYDRVLTFAQELRLPLEHIESRLLAVNHAEAMERVLVAWRLPKGMVRPIAMHHLSVASLRRLAGDSFVEACTLALANRLAHAMVLGGSGNDLILRTDELVVALKVEPEVIAKIERTIPAQTDEIKFAMLAHSTHEPWACRRNEARDQLPQALRPMYVSKTREMDAFRIVCDQLCRDAGAGAPNLGVVFLSAPGEAPSLMEALQEAETAAGVDLLPLIVLSASGKWPVEDALMTNRQVRILPTTLPISTFLTTVNQLLANETP